MQTEIWSTRTTKKIIASVVVLFVIAHSALFILNHWLNPWERQAARLMLKHAERVRSASLDDFKKEVEAAKASEDLAERRVWTSRDQQIEISARSLIGAAEICRKSELTPVVVASGDSRRQIANEQLAQFGGVMCNAYEIEELASRHALNRRSGF